MELKDKKETRKYILEKRDNIDLSKKREWDAQLFDKLINSEFYKEAKVIFTFVSFRSEVDTHEIINQALKDNKTVCVPRIKSKETGIEVFKIKGMHELEQGYYGILEPADYCPKVGSADIDLILMPGVAFDKDGGRIGYGAGYYDRFLTSIDEKVKKIALGYEFQVLEEVPMDEHDIRIDAIITNESIIKVN